MPMSNFVHLHVHTPYSLLDGACRIDALVDRAKELGMSALAITDHGNLFGAVAFYEACVKKGIKPIIGCEIYLDDERDTLPPNRQHPTHMTLLCMNLIGYHNLVKLVSIGHQKQTGLFPSVTTEELARHQMGIIALSGCRNSKISLLLQDEDYFAAKELALQYKQMFADGRFYLEMMDHSTPFDNKVKRLMAKLASEVHIPLAATNDVHFINPYEAQTQHILGHIGDPQRMDLQHTTHYFRSSEEMEKLLFDYPAAVYNTLHIAGMCNVRLDFSARLLPKFEKIGVTDNVAYLRYLASKGLAGRYEIIPEEAKEHLFYELSVIEEMGFTDYFLIVADFVEYARQNDIPVGPGRGSGVGSLTAYCLGITEIDPLQYGLLFERFLNPERVSMPDFDIDFCYERRSEMIEYVTRKYGRECVAQIVTFGTLAAKASIRDVGRIMQIDPQVYGDIARMIPGGMKMTLDKALAEVEQLRNYYENDAEAKRLIDAARSVEGLPRHTATHAAGVVIAPGRIEEYVPTAKNDGVVVTQYNMTELEKLGLLKIDFLGSRNLTALRDCEREIQKTDPDFSLQNIPLDEAAVYEMLSDGETDGVFQLESEGIRRVLRQMKPRCFADIIAVIALYRPGPMDSIPAYIERMHDERDITYLHPCLKPILEETYGCIVYQEQVMQICRAMAGFSYGKADILRRAMSKKKKDVMLSEKEDFLNGCAANGIDARVAMQVFDQMESFASYAFNKSHAAAYALVTYRTAYCRRFYPVQFFAALMNAFCESTAKVAGYVNVCKQMGIGLRLPDINKANCDFTPLQSEIAVGLRAIKGVGVNLADRIVYLREREPFVGLEDFGERMAKVCSKPALESLILSGAFDQIEKHNRAEMLLAYDALIKTPGMDGRGNIVGQLSLFAPEEMGDTLWRKCEPHSTKRLREQERSVMEFLPAPDALEAVDFEKLPADFVPLESLLADVTDKIGRKFTLFGVLEQIREIRTKKGDRMAFATLRDQTGSIELVIFSNTFTANEKLMKENFPLYLRGSLRDNDGKPQFIPDWFSEIYRIEKRTATHYQEPKPRYDVYIKVRNERDVRLHIAARLFAAHPGEDAVMLFFEESNRCLLWRQYPIRFDKKMSKQLKSLFGDARVVNKIRKKQ